MLSGDMKLSRINVNGHLLTRYSTNSDDSYLGCNLWWNLTLSLWSGEQTRIDGLETRLRSSKPSRGDHFWTAKERSTSTVCPMKPQWMENITLVCQSITEKRRGKNPLKDLLLQDCFFFKSWLGNHDVEVLIIGYRWLENWKEQVRVLEGKLKSKYPALSVWGTFWYPSHNGYILILAGMSVSSIIIMGSSVNLQLCPYFHNISGK